MGKITYNDKVKINELTDVPAINKVQDVDMNEIKTSVNTIYDALGTGTDTYSASTSYVVGDMVIYNGTIYKCINATSGAWNPANWSLVPIFENDMINESLLPVIFDSYSNVISPGYIRFGNGIQIAWVEKAESVTLAAWGNIFYADVSDLPNWSVPFTQVYQTIISTNNKQFWGTCDGSSSTKPGAVRLLRATAGSSQSVTVRALAIGKWK